MGKAEGLNSIVLAPNGNSYKYKIVNGEVVDFECEFTLINYSRKDKHFVVEGYINDLVRFEIYDKQDELIRSFLRGKGSENYRFNNNNFNIKIYGLDNMGLSHKNYHIIVFPVITSKLSICMYLKK